jgi:transcriptional regulator with XRE-family HTH domain/predicted transcriptional regulator
MTTEPPKLDLLTLGRRVRHYRTSSGMTLGELGERVGKPAPYLSNIETGKREPRLGLLNELASILGVTTADLLDPTPPTHRDALEIQLDSVQATALYAEMGLPYVKPGRAVPDQFIEHILTLFRALQQERRVAAATPQEALAANRLLAEHLGSNDLYFPDLEQLAAQSLKAVDFDGSGPIPGTLLIDLAASMGWTFRQVSELPAAARVVADKRHRRILIRQRDELRTRRARTVILQTLGHFLLEHPEPTSFADFLKHRMEANYYAGAVLAPERSAVPFLVEAKEARRLSVEDLKEVFYINYRMAAHRFTNLALPHLGLRTHFVRSDDQGVVWKAYGINDVPFPTDAGGSVTGQRLCREWGTRAVFHSEDKYGIHYQFTDTPAGTFWCATHIEVDRDPQHAVTVGVGFNDSRYFRGSDTNRRTVSRCPEGECCRRPPADLADMWTGQAFVALGSGALNSYGVPASGLPGIDLTEVYEFLGGLEG